MIGRIRPRIRSRKPRIDTRWVGRGLLASVALCAVAMADVPATPVPSKDSRAASQQSPPKNAPNDDFIEFLGADDMDDAAWWEFMKKAQSRRGNPPAAAPQETKR